MSTFILQSRAKAEQTQGYKAQRVDFRQKHSHNLGVGNRSSGQN